MQGTANGVFVEVATGGNRFDRRKSPPFAIARGDICKNPKLLASERIGVHFTVNEQVPFFACGWFTVTHCEAPISSDRLSNKLRAVWRLPITESASWARVGSLATAVMRTSANSLVACSKLAGGDPELSRAHERAALLRRVLPVRAALLTLDTLGVTLISPILSVAAVPDRGGSTAPPVLCSHALIDLIAQYDAGRVTAPWGDG